MELFKLLGKISIDGVSEAKSGISSVASAASSLATTIGKGITIGAQAMGAAITAGSAAVAKLGTTAVQAYADYEQLVGGVETLFKESSDQVMQYANEAYKSAGLSANEYMETVTSFSASLLQSLDNDTAAAAEKANMAIKDMSDNANKMGTAMSSIQNAYQGFAKQNYTMLDNLKLGYGGTKEEMQRLVTDASKLSETVKSAYEEGALDFDNIVEAIHVIQDEIGITGTTAKEAGSTITGSLASMKSAWKNLLTAMPDDNQDMDVLLDRFVKSFETAMGNLVPRIQKLAPRLTGALSSLVSTATPYLTDAIESLLPGLLEAGTMLVTELAGELPGLAEVLFSSLSGVLKEAFPGASELIEGFELLAEELVPPILETGKNIVEENLGPIADAVGETLQELAPKLGDLAEKLGPVLEQIAKLAADATVRAIQDLGTAVGNLADFCSALIEVFDGDENTVINFISSLGDIAYSLTGVSSAMSVLIYDLPTLTSLLKGTGTEAEGVGASFEKGSASVEAASKTISNSIQNIFSFAAMLTPAIDSGAAAFTNLGQSAIDAVNTVKYQIQLMVNSVIGAYNQMADLVNNAIGDSAVGNMLKLSLSSATGLPDHIDMFVIEPSTNVYAQPKSKYDWEGAPIQMKDGMVVPPKMARGGVLEKGQIGFLEGDGAEAVVPLDRNRAWINAVAQDMGDAIGWNQSESATAAFREVLADLPDMLIEAFASMRFDVNNREFARLVKAVN